MRVLAVAQRLVGAFEREHEVLRQRRRRAWSHSTIAASYAAVRGERLERERAARLGAERRRRSRAARRARARTAPGSVTIADPRVVLRRGARHRGAADVDRLDVGPFEERVEVDDDELERLDAVRARDRRGADSLPRSARMPAVHASGAASRPGRRASPGSR